MYLSITQGLFAKELLLAFLYSNWWSYDIRYIESSAFVCTALIFKDTWKSYAHKIAIIYQQIQITVF